MYIDGVILFGILIVVLTCVVVVYLGIYSWKHIKQDSQRAAREAADGVDAKSQAVKT